MKIEIIKQRLAALKSERSTVEQMWMILERFVVPYRGEFFMENNSENSINWRKRQIYDATAPQAAEMLASSLHGNLTSASSQWFDFNFKNKQLLDLSEAKVWIQTAAANIFNAINESNFDLKIGEFYLDLTGFNNAFLSFEEEDGEFIFDSIPLKEGYMELDHKGGIINFYRKLNWTPLKMESKFGFDNLPKKIQEKLKSGKATDKYEIIMCIYKRDADTQADLSKPTSIAARPYGCKWFIEACGSPLGEETGYYEMPVYFVPWRRTSDSQWGNGPSSLSLSNILSLNEIVEQMLEGTAKAIDPPIFTTQRNIVGDADFSRSGLTVLKQLDGVREFVTNARLDVGASQIEDFRKSIERSFHIDQLMLKESPAMTATEVTVRYELMQKLLGPTLGRIQKNLLDPLIERAISIGLRKGIVPPIPDVVKQNEGQIDIKYTGPLPRAQKMQTAIGIQEWLGMSGEIAQVFPDAGLVPKTEEAIREIGNLRGVPADLMNDKEDVASEKKKQEKAQQQAQALEMANAEGQAMQSMGQGEQAMQEQSVQ